MITQSTTLQSWAKFFENITKTITVLHNRKYNIYRIFSNNYYNVFYMNYSILNNTTESISIAYTICVIIIMKTKSRKNKSFSKMNSFIYDFVIKNAILIKETLALSRPTIYCTYSIHVFSRKWSTVVRKPKHASESLRVHMKQVSIIKKIKK